MGGRGRRREGRAAGGGLDDGRPHSHRLSGRLPHYKGVHSTCLSQTPAGGAGCRDRGLRESRVTPCPEARRRWTCLRGTAPRTRLGVPTTGGYSPRAPRLITFWTPASPPSGMSPAEVSLRPHLDPILPRAPAQGYVEKVLQDSALDHPALKEVRGRRWGRGGVAGGQRHA